MHAQTHSHILLISSSSPPRRSILTYHIPGSAVITHLTHATECELVMNGPLSVLVVPELERKCICVGACDVK